MLLEAPAAVRDLPPAVGTGYAWRPDAATATVVLVHGLQSHAGWFQSAGARLAERGVAVYAPDRRGSGRSTAPRGDVADFRRWYEDLADVVSFARSEHPHTDVHVVGHCFGANIALGAVLSGLTPQVASIVMLTPGLYVLPTYPIATKVRIAAAGVFSPNTRFRVPQDDALFSRDPAVLGWIAADTLGARYVTARTLVQINAMLRHLRAQVHTLEIPTLVLEAARDRLSDNVRNRALLQQALGDRCAWRTFDAEHFLLAEPCVDQVIDTLVRWTIPHAQGALQ